MAYLHGKGPEFCLELDPLSIVHRFYETPWIFTIGYGSIPCMVALIGHYAPMQIMVVKVTMGGDGLPQKYTHKHTFENTNTLDKISSINKICSQNC